MVFGKLVSAAAACVWGPGGRRQEVVTLGALMLRFNTFMTKDYHQVACLWVQTL